MGCGKRWLVALGLGGAASGAQAQDLGARAQGHGDAGRADMADVSALSQNLATVTMKERYELFAGTALGPDSRFVLRGGALDTRTSPSFSIGAGYERLVENVAPTGSLLPGWKDPTEALDNPSLVQSVYAGIGVPILARHLSFAATGRYGWGSSELGGDATSFDFGVSAAARPADTVTLAVGGRNLLNSDAAAHPRSVDLAVRWQPGDSFGIEGDAVAPAEGKLAVSRLGWHVGADASIAEWLVVRGGYANVATNSYATAGVGLTSEKASLDYGIRLDVADPARNWHALDLRVSF